MTMIEERFKNIELQKKMKIRRFKARNKKLKECKEEIKAGTEARTILQLAAKKTQANVEKHFSEIITNALKTIFDDPYKFEIKFEERRNHTECDLFLVKGKIRKKLNFGIGNPIFGIGGGVIDIVSLASRLAYWKLEKSDPIIGIDEPFKNLELPLLPRAIEFLKMLNREFGIQFIINTHIPQISKKADKIFEIKNGKELLHGYNEEQT